MPSSRTAADEVCDEHICCQRYAFNLEHIQQIPSWSAGGTHGHQSVDPLLEPASHDSRTEVRVKDRFNRVVVTGQRLVVTTSTSESLSTAHSRCPWMRAHAELHNCFIQSATALYPVPSLEVVHSSENTPFDLSPNLSYRILQIYICNNLHFVAASCRPIILQLQL